MKKLLLTCLLLLTFLLSARAATPVTSLRSDSSMVRYLESTFHVKFTDNNSIILFKNGREKFADLLPALEAAQHSIHMEYFNFRNDSISKEVFARLVRKAAEGVQVRVLFDGFGNSSNNLPLKNQHLDTLRARGVEIYQFDRMRFPWANHAFHRDHRKIVVIDGLVAYTGGMNVADYYLKGKPELGEWRDIHMRVEGDAVAGLQGVFLDFWNRVTYQQVSGTEYFPGMRSARKSFVHLPADTTATAGRKRVGVVNRDPQRTPAIIHDTYIHAVEHAERQIMIINPYFTLCRHLRRALKRAAKRGIDLQIMVSEKCDIPVSPRLIERITRQLQKCGAKVYFYQGGFHHSKIMMIDSLYTFAGSANMNGRSMSCDYECNLLIADTATTAQLQRIFAYDRDHRCFLLTTERYKQLSLWKRFLGRFLQPLVPLVHEPHLKQHERGRHKHAICPTALQPAYPHLWVAASLPSPQP